MNAGGEGQSISRSVSVKDKVRIGRPLGDDGQGVVYGSGQCHSQGVVYGSGQL